MLNKALSHQKEALNKSVYLCAAILDPRANTNKIYEDTLNSARLANKDKLIFFFTNKACDLEKTNDPDIEFMHLPSSDEDDEDDCPQNFRSKQTPILV